MAKGKGGGKPCGASHISPNKVCRVYLSSGVDSALTAAARGMKNKADPLYGNWEVNDLERHKKFLLEKAPAGSKLDEQINRIEAVIAQKKAPVVPGSVKKDLAALASKDPQTEAPGTMTKLWALVNSVQGSAEPQSRAARAKALGEDEGTLVRNKNTAASTNTKWHRQDAKDFDSDFSPTETRGNKKYDWSESYGPGTKELGSGSFGQVMKTKGPPPLAVKRGEIGKDEAALIEKVGKADLGPKLVSGQVSVSKFAKPGETLHAGRLAMTLVPGRDLNDRKAEDKVGNTTVGDAFWKARGDLHRLGIAHNDMHPGNVFVDEKGKGRFVDMGLAQNNPKAALSEAMGAFEPPKAWNVPTRVNSIGEPDRGDWQVKRFRDMTGVRSKFPSDAPETYRKINSNRIDLENRMRKDGLSNQEIGQIMGDGIRNKDSVYRNGAWAKITDEQAKSYINDLYKGV